MYSNKKIPAPFRQPGRKTGQNGKSPDKQPASPAKTEAPKAEPLPVFPAEKKTPQKKPSPQTVSPFLALALLELFSANKEG